MGDSQGGGAPLSGLVDAVGITPAIRFFLPSFFFAKKKRKEVENGAGGGYINKKPEIIEIMTGDIKMNFDKIVVPEVIGSPLERTVNFLFLIRRSWVTLRETVLDLTLHPRR